MKLGFVEAVEDGAHFAQVLQGGAGVFEFAGGDAGEFAEVGDASPEVVQALVMVVEVFEAAVHESDGEDAALFVVGQGARFEPLQAVGKGGCGEFTVARDVVAGFEVVVDALVADAVAAGTSVDGLLDGTLLFGIDGGAVFADFADGRQDFFKRSNLGIFARFRVCCRRMRR